MSTQQLLHKVQSAPRSAASTQGKGTVANHSLAITQRKLQAKADCCSQVSQLLALQAKMAHGKIPLQRKKNETGMPDNLKAGVESLSGVGMDDVKVHYNSSQPAQLNALAYAQGTDIHIAPGQEQHLPHEAWHVAQQKQGRVQPTTQLKESVPINDDPGLEHEADVMGAKAMQMQFPSNEESVQGKFGAAQLTETAQLSAAEEELKPAQGKFDPLQRMGMDEELTTQGKFETAQLASPEEELT